MAFLTKDDFLMIDFSRFRDCRLVKAEDAQGRPCEGIFIPFRQNFIHYLHKSSVPALSVRFFAMKDANNVASHLAIPISSRAEYAELVKDGLIEPGLEQWSQMIGRVYSFSKLEKQKARLRAERKPIYDKNNRGGGV